MNQIVRCERKRTSTGGKPLQNHALTFVEDHSKLICLTLSAKASRHDAHVSCAFDLSTIDWIMPEEISMPDVR